MKTFFLTLKKWLLLVLLILACLASLYFDVYDFLNFETLKSYQTIAQVWTIEHYQITVAFYILVYIILIACAIPCATVLTLLGGFLFGNIAVVYAVFCTTIGGSILCLAVRTAIGVNIAAKSSGWIKRMEHGFQRNAFHYLLMLRLVPVFPCWISNVSAGALNVPLKTFISATVLGLLPSTFIYVMAGRSLDKLLSSEQTFDFASLLTPSILFPLIGLTILSLSPLLYHSFKKLNRC